MADVIRVKREGGRGSHLIAKAKYDANPDAYERMDAAAKPDQAPVTPTPAKRAFKKRGG